MLTTLRHIGAMTRPWWAADSSALQSRTSQIRVNSTTGAVAGSAGTLPPNWASATPTGLTRTISLSSYSGIEFIEINWVGTAGTTAAITVTDEAVNGIAGVSGQTWTYSSFLGIGPTTGVTQLNLDLQGTDGASQTELFGTDFFASLGRGLRRIAGTWTLANVGTTNVRGRLRTDAITSTTSVDFTLRIGLPMLHQGSVALSPLRTSGAARTGVHSSMVGRV